MIPRIIHFCWLSNDPYPAKIKACLDSWKSHLHGYEIKLWDYNRFPRGKSIWVDQAFDAGKYAFAADYIRAYALYHEGGIYLDSDVETLKDFEDFISFPYFFGQEADSGRIEAAVMGAEAGNPIFDELLKHYEEREFVKKDGSYDMKPLPAILSEIVDKKGKCKTIDNPADFDKSGDVINIFTPEFFSPLHIVNLRLETTPKTVAIHHFAGTWSSPYHRFKKRMQRVIGPSATTVVQRIKRLFVR